MNAILLTPEDFVAEQRVHLTDRRLAHVLEVHRAAVGERLRVGLVGGKLGTGTVTALDKSALEMEVTLDTDPPTPAPLTLIVALPRPKSMRKVLHVATTLGIKQIHLINAHRVDKSYWKSPRLKPEAVKEVLTLGLEQSVDTILPGVSFHRRIRWFIEDDLPALCAGKRCLIAHPGASEPCPRALDRPCALAIGPEGGFQDYEVGYFVKAGFTAVTMGPRILRVEEAVAALAGRIL